jgi:hypothetical protein
MTKDAAPKYGFGSSSRSRQAKNGTPGPGNYTIEGHPTKNSAPRGLLVPRRPDSAPVKGRNTPGPGTYSAGLSNKMQSPRYGFGTGVKSSKPNKD